MPYCGVLQQSLGYSLTLDCANTNGAGTAVTVFTIRKDRVADVDTITYTAGSTTARTIESGAARLIFIVNPPAGASASLKITQDSGATTLGGVATADSQFVFDVV